MIIVLLGYMGVGKSAVGQQLSKIIAYSFIDLDDYIEEQEGKSISEIFKTKGEIYFRKKEHQYLKEILAKYDKVVLSLGGGTPCYANNMEVLKNKKVISIYLQLSPKELSNRLFSIKEHRPLLREIKSSEKLTEFIAIHLFERQAFYNQAKHCIVTSHLSIQEITELIVKRLY